MGINEKSIDSDWLPHVYTEAELYSLNTSNLRDGQVTIVRSTYTLYMWSKVLNMWTIPYCKAQGAISTPPGFVYGCRLKYVDSTHVGLNTGSIDIFGTMGVVSALRVIGWSALEAGSTLKASTWYFVYVESDGNGGVTEFISELHPTRDAYYTIIDPFEQVPRYHPTRDARFIGSFRTSTTSTIVAFNVVGDHVTYTSTGNPLILSAGAATVRTAINIRSAVPITSLLATVYAESLAGSNVKRIGTLDTWIYNIILSSIAAELPLSPISNIGSATATASSQSSTTTNPPKAIDGSTSTAWRKIAADTNPRLYIDMGSIQTFTAFAISAYLTTVQSLTIAHSLDNVSFTNVYTGAPMVDPQYFVNVISARYWRVTLNTYNSTTAGISEFTLYSSIPTAVYYICTGNSINVGVTGYSEII